MMFSVTTFFLILAGCAVKSDDTSNYFVVQMPEEDFQKETPHKTLQVYWNVPTIQCKSKRIPIEKLHERYGIIQNSLDNFRGDKVAIMYDPGYFPAIFKNTSTGELVLRNGGVPQEGDLELHMKQFRKDLEHQIGDPDFDGVGIIDFESWRPIFRQNFGTLEPYQKLSCDIEKKKHWWWPSEWIKAEATKRFEDAARGFMQNTISIAKQLRPRARWGYYGFPYCFNHVPSVAKCANLMPEENDRLYWLWSESTALFPSIYSSASLTTPQLSAFIKARVSEAARLARGSTPVLPYWWYRYRDSGYLEQADVTIALQTLYRSSASGCMIWGSSADVNTPDKCHKLLKYIESVLGPSIAKYARFVPKTEELNGTEVYSEDGNFFLATTSKPYGTENITESLNSNVENETYMDADTDEEKTTAQNASGFGDILTSTTEMGVHTNLNTVHSTRNGDVITTSPIITLLDSNNDKDTSASLALKVKTDSTTQLITLPHEEYEETYITSVEDVNIVFNEEDFFDVSDTYFRKNVDTSTVPALTDFTNINTYVDIEVIQETKDTASSIISTTTELNSDRSTSTSESFNSVIADKSATDLFEESTAKFSTTSTDDTDLKTESYNARAETITEYISENITPMLGESTTAHMSIKTTTSGKDNNIPVLLEKNAESTTATITERTQLSRDWKNTQFTNNEEPNETFEDNETVLKDDPTAMGLTSRDKVLI